MKNFNIFNSNRLEILIDKLALSLKEPLPDPFEKEIIVVQSNGMEKFLSLELSKRLDITANTDFLYPNSMLDLCIEKTGVLADDIWKYSVDKYAWTLMDLIPEFESNPLFEDVFSYVKYNNILNKEKLYQFCLRISEAFQQYQIFRPDWILEWEKTDIENNWQAVLWKRLSEKIGLDHGVRLVEKAFEVSSENPYILSSLPKRISIFGIFSIPKIYLESLSFFSSHTEVNFYLLNPCKEYWGDIVSTKRIDKIKSLKDTEDDLYFESGNQLLASFGQSGRNFFDLINEYHPNIVDEDYDEPANNSLLENIQSGILNLEDPAKFGKSEIDISDNSVRIHSCHGPMREMEVLRDNILMLLENDDDLNFGDILVMIPDIEKYSPYISSVFSRKIDNKKIPFSIADRSLKSENHAATAFFKILNLFKSRYEASLVVNLFEERIIYSKFRLSDNDIEKVRNWITGLDIAWGLDEEFKAELDLPKDDTGTWKKGIKSLVLGHALSPDNLNFFNGLLPHEEIETGDIDILSGFISFFDKISYFSSKILNSSYSVSEWIDIFYEITDSFLSFDSEFEFDVIRLKELLRSVRQEAEEAMMESYIPFPVIFERIEKLILESSQNSGFLDGRITFCAMIPMRSIPFKMIALCGMNESDFPRDYVPPEFDLIVKNKRKGDRNVRDDDRYLFLETLISARKYFYITYTGQDYKTDTIIPPSVVVAEFADYIEDNFYIKDKDENYIKDRILRFHKAPSFSSDYFLYDDSFKADSENKKFSFSQRLRDLAQAVDDNKSLEIVFYNEPMKKEEDEEKVIDLTSFISFFKNPQRFYLRFNQIETGIEHKIFSDRELFYPDGLKKYQITNEVLNLYINGESFETIDMFLKSRNLIPFGKTGEILINELKSQVFKFGSKIKDYLKNHQKISAGIEIKDRKIIGNIELFNENIFLYRYGKIKPENILETYIKHSFAALDKKSLSFKNSYFAGIENSKPCIVSFCKNGSEADHFNVFFDLYEKGCIEPVNFHPLLSHKYVSGLLKSAKNKMENITDELRFEALSKTENEMNSKRSFTDYTWLNKTFRGKDFLTKEFIEISESIFLPVLLSMETE